MSERDYLGVIYGAAALEAEKAMTKFPQPNYTTLKVAEESGELIKAAVHYAEGRDEWGHVEEEAIQTISMIFRLLIEGDEVNGIIPPVRR